MISLTNKVYMILFRNNLYFVRVCTVCTAFQSAVYTYLKNTHYTNTDFYTHLNIFNEKMILYLGACILKVQFLNNYTPNKWKYFHIFVLYFHVAWITSIKFSRYMINCVVDRSTLLSAQSLYCRGSRLT